MIEVIPEHMDIAATLGIEKNKHWLETPSSILARQRDFLCIEIARSKRIRADHSVVIMDRTILSVLAYLYVRTRKHPDCKVILDKFLRECLYYIKNGAVVVPSFIFIILISPIQVQERMMQARAAGDNRNTEPYLLQNDTILQINEFYQCIANRINALTSNLTRCSGRLLNIEAHFTNSILQRAKSRAVQLDCFTVARLWPFLVSRQIVISISY